MSKKKATPDWTNARNVGITVYVVVCVGIMFWLDLVATRPCLADATLYDQDTSDKLYSSDNVKSAPYTATDSRISCSTACWTACTPPSKLSSI